MDVREKLQSEKRLIDYDEIRRLFDVQYKETVQLIRDGETHLDNLAEGFLEADRIIKKIPTVDAVEVLRCKDCKHRYKDSWCEYVDDDDNFYCARGERKEGADNA